MNSRKDLDLESRSIVERVVYLRKNSPEAFKSILKIIDLEMNYPGIIQCELLDHIDILADSAKVGKYQLNNWLTPNGRKCSRKENYESINRHIKESISDKNYLDKESNRPPRLHAAIRLMMDHTRIQRGIKHDADK